MCFNNEILPRVTDFHTHVLPGVDDGAKDVETSLAMLRMMAAGGIRRAVATPHFYPWRDSPEAFLARREAAFSALYAAGSNDTGVFLTPGAEVAYFRGIGRSAAAHALTVGNTDLMLVELPFEKWDAAVFDDLSDLVRAGRVPVLAHLDRYPWANKRVFAELRARGCLIQCNAEPFLAKRPPRLLCKMMQEGNVDFIGSDCHNTSDRAPTLGAALCALSALGYAGPLSRIADRSETLY